MRGSHTGGVYVRVMDSTLVYFEIIELELHYMVLSLGVLGMLARMGSSYFQIL